jgi:hypothetical protein
MLPEEMGIAQNGNPNVIAEPFDLRYWAAFKMQRIAHDQPEVISIGSSRGHEMRSAMFAPYKFYNASLTAWTLAQEIDIVDRITKVSNPRVIIAGIDYTMFTDAVAGVFDRERTMRYNNGLHYRYHGALVAISTVRSDPLLLNLLYERNKTTTPYFLGMNAIRYSTGFRFDGSRLLPRSAYQSAPGYLAKNSGLLDAVPGALHADSRQLADLAKLAGLCRERGVLLVAIQFPIFKASVDFLDKDSSYHASAGIWREFQSNEMTERFRDLGIVFFDLSRSPMTSDGQYFTDAAHPTEAGMSVAMSELLNDERFHAIFPKIDGERLRRDRERAADAGDPFEIYGNILH